MQNKIFIKLIYIFIFFSTIYVYSEDVNEIIQKANIASYYQGDDGRAEVKMIITDNQGRTREREFVILRKDKEDGKNQFFYVYFYTPADVRKMAFMVWKNPGKDDDRWLYLASLDLVKRIAATDKRSSFVGSDFLYEDVSGRGIDEDNHELLEENDQFFIIKNIPKNPSNVEFAYYKIWIDKVTYLPNKAEYYNTNDKVYRTVEALSVETIQNFPSIKASKVTNIETGSVTLLEFKKIEYNIGLTENIFSERFLRRPPKETRK